MSEDKLKLIPIFDYWQKCPGCGTVVNFPCTPDLAALDELEGLLNIRLEDIADSNRHANEYHGLMMAVKDLYSIRDKYRGKVWNAYF